MRLGLWIGIAALLWGCEKAPSAKPGGPPVGSPAPSAAAASAVAPMTEAAALFWFNSRAISDSGQNLYGRYAYSRLLPLLSPTHQKNPDVWFVASDGDYLGAVTVPASGPDEEKILGE